MIFDFGELIIFLMLIGYGVMGLSLYKTFLFYGFGFKHETFFEIFPIFPFPIFDFKQRDFHEDIYLHSTESLDGFRGAMAHWKRNVKD